MAMNHYVGGNNLAPQVYKEGDQRNGIYGSAEPPVVQVDATAIDGSSINMAGTALSRHGLLYLGGRNITTGEVDFSRLTRAKFPALSGNISLSCWGAQGNNSTTGIDLYVDSSGNIRSTMYSDDGLRGLNAVTASTGMSTNTWYDIGYTWDNSTKELKIYLDGVLHTTHVSTRSFSSSFTGTDAPQLSIGVSGSQANTYMHLNEDVFWDEIVDFTSGGLNTNGASRTTPLSFTATPNESDPGIANVRTGTAYVFGGDSKTGTATIPSADDVRSGTAVDATTGNMTLPAIADVESGVTFGTSGTELTGTLNLPSEDDVRNATSYNGGSNTGNMTLPAAGDVQEAVTYGTSGTELTGTFGVPTEAQVQSGIGFGAGDTEFTGSLALAAPDAGDLRDGVTVGAVTGTLDVPAIGDVRSGTQYGEDGTQYTGTLAVSGGGVTKKKINTGNIG